VRRHLYPLLRAGDDRAWHLRDPGPTDGRLLGRPALPDGDASRLYHLGMHARNHGVSSFLVCCSSVSKQPVAPPFLLLLVFVFVLFSLPDGDARRFRHLGMYARNHGAFSSSLVCCSSSSARKQPDAPLFFYDSCFCCYRFLMGMLAGFVISGHARNQGASSSLLCCSSVCRQPGVSIISIRVPVVIASSSERSPVSSYRDACSQSWCVFFSCLLQ